MAYVLLWWLIWIIWVTSYWFLGVVLLEYVIQVFQFLNLLQVVNYRGFSLFFELLQRSMSLSSFWGFVVMVLILVGKILVMSSQCGEIDNMLGLGIVKWFFMEDLIVYRFGIQGTPHYPSSSFISRGLVSGCPHCLYVAVLMDLR